MDLKYLLKAEEFDKKAQDIKKIFFYRICGTGMGAAACLLKEKGYNIEGADLSFYPPMGNYLKSMKIPCYQLKDVADEYLRGFDLIVVGNVVPRNSKDAERIEKLGIPFCSFPSVLGNLLFEDLNVVGIAGTHGKTTTTYLFSQLFKKLGFDPGYFIGGVLEDSPSSVLGDGSYFFIESDEYDSAYFEKISKFRLYRIKHMIITSLEMDHADIFENVEQIKDEFRHVVHHLENGKIIASSDYVALKELSEEKSGQANWIFYGDKSPVGPEILNSDKNGTSFKLTLAGHDREFFTNVVGKHNIFNLSSAIIFAFNEGFSYEKINHAIKDLKMVKRRQEVKGIYREALIIDDFAHHPTAVKSTIDTIKTKYSDKNIITVFAPTSATARSSLFQEGFADSLLESDRVILVKPEKPTSIKKAGDLDCAVIANHLKDEKVDVHLVDRLDLLIELINNFANSDSLFLVLSNSTCLGLWESDFINEIEI